MKFLKEFFEMLAHVFRHDLHKEINNLKSTIEQHEKKIFSLEKEVIFWKSHALNFRKPTV